MIDYADFTAWLVLSIGLSFGLIIMLMVGNSFADKYPSLYCAHYNATPRIQCTDNFHESSCYKCCYSNNSCFDFKNVTLI
jgi:hypothetical protein